MDVYTTPPWPALCAQVAVLKIERPSGVGFGPLSLVADPDEPTAVAEGDSQFCSQSDSQLLEDSEIT